MKFEKTLNPARQFSEFRTTGFPGARQKQNVARLMFDENFSATIGKNLFARPVNGEFIMVTNKLLFGLSLLVAFQDRYLFCTHCCFPFILIGAKLPLEAFLITSVCPVRGKTKKFKYVMGN